MYGPLAQSTSFIIHNKYIQILLFVPQKKNVNIDEDELLNDILQDMNVPV